MVGPMVTNPATRDWTVTASLFATLNEMYGNRTVCGIGRGDSAVRVINGKPVTLRRAARVDRRHPRRWPTARRSTTRAPRCGCRGAPTAALRGLGRRLRAEGARARRRGRRRLHPPARRSRHHGVEHRAPCARRRGGRPRPGRGEDLRGRPGLRHRRQRAPAWTTRATSAAGSAGWSATTWPTSSPATAPTAPRSRPRSPDYIAGREGYDYNEHGRAGNTHTPFVPDEIVDRFCLIGPPAAQVERLRGAARARRRPVRPLPPARRQGRDALGLR